jgi:DNA-binding LacI/PurR family transcriptional regulator
MVGIVSSNTDRFGYAKTIQGVEEAARAAGFLVAIAVVNSDIPAAVNLMLGQPLAGVIVLDFDAQGAEALAYLPQQLPIAAVSSTTVGRPVPRVLFDDRKGGREATEFLLGLGHAIVHYVAVPGSGRPSGRLEGWRDALVAAGIPIPDVMETDWSSQSGYQAGEQLAKDPEVTAILCGNDEIAFGVMKALQVHGRRVPEDVSVVGFDDHPHAALWTPSLTTMAQDFVQLGRVAFNLLLQDIDNVDAPTVSAPPPVLHLIERESTSVPGSHRSL